MQLITSTWHILEAKTLWFLRTSLTSHRFQKLPPPSQPLGSTSTATAAAPVSSPQEEFEGVPQTTPMAPPLRAPSNVHTVRTYTGVNNTNGTQTPFTTSPLLLIHSAPNLLGELPWIMLPIYMIFFSSTRCPLQIKDTEQAPLPPRIPPNMLFCDS